MPVPEQPLPDQPLNFQYDEDGVAVRVTELPFV
ncbi:MAG: hypothetical protein UT81_C0023G0004 [Parcubacteria group bacterium GW2011_GWA2_40_14]|nr:MAG: hypothetical protein UT81_C0023G0004 [Parcubacteria group bacterium GW2011_GWA2_40_14]